MAGVNRFEDLRVWQAARRQGARVGRLIKRRNFNEDRQLVKQISGASVSVMNNISEGFLRRNDPEFSQFLRYAIASNGEVRSCFYTALDRSYLTTREANELIEENNGIGRMIRRLKQYLDGEASDQQPRTGTHEAPTGEGPRTPGTD